MPIKQDEWKKIQTAIDESIQRAVAPLTPASGFQRVTRWLRTWGAITALWTIPLALLGLLITVSIFAVNGITKNATFQTSTDDRLKSIERQLTGIYTDLAQQGLKAQAALPPSEFKANLANLGSTISSIRDQKLEIPKGVINDIQQKMVSTDPNAAGYWPAAAELISYHSQLLALVAELPSKDCIDDRTILIAIFDFRSCVLDLDGTATASLITCDHCLVRYSGGHITVHGARFTNCLFVVMTPKNQAPEKTGQQFEEALLASDLKDVSISSFAYAS